MGDTNQGKAKPEEEQELTFVVTTNPYDRSSAANKRRVRSVAALRSWPERRKKTFENVDHSGARGGFVLDLPEPVVPPPRPVVRREGSASKKRKAVEAAGPATEEEEPLFETCTRAFNDDCGCIHCRSERTYLRRQDSTAALPSSAVDARIVESGIPLQSRKRTADGEVKTRTTGPAIAAAAGERSVMLTPPASPLPTPLPTINNEGRAEPFNCYPVPYRPWFDRILHHSESGSLPEPVREELWSLTLT